MIRSVSLAAMLAVVLAAALPSVASAEQRCATLDIPADGELVSLATPEFTVHAMSIPDYFDVGRPIMQWSGAFPAVVRVVRVVDHEQWHFRHAYSDGIESGGGAYIFCWQNPNAAPGPLLPNTAMPIS